MSTPALPDPAARSLGPDCVGLRVVVRRRVPGRTGPSGGPLLTDLLGIMEEWTASTTTIRAADGRRTTIPLGDLVSGKPVPPRPSVRHRVGTEELARITASWWPSEPGTLLDRTPPALLIAGVARASRQARALLPQPPATVRLEEDTLGPVQVAVASLGSPAVARARASLSPQDPAWVGLSDLWVAPDERHGPLSAAAVVHGLLGWAAERGATTAVVAAGRNDDEAQALWERLGFEEHHPDR